VEWLGRETGHSAPLATALRWLSRLETAWERATWSLHLSPPDDFRAGLPPPQFRLSTLFWLTAVLCALFTIMGTVGPYGAFALILFVLAVIAHVAGNALGTKLRESGDRPLLPPHDLSPRSSRFRRPDAAEFAPTTQLRDRYPLGIIIAIMTGVGALLGATVGGGLLAWLNWENATPLNVVFGVIFAGLLGGFAGFLLSSFVRVSIGANLQAMREAKRH
jgi:MFS family permease